MTHTLSIAPAWIICQGQTVVRRDKTPDQFGNPPVDGSAVLGSCPKTLYMLWDEWVNGIGGAKLAREFTHCER